MNITRTSREFNKKEIYKLTKAQDIKRMSDIPEEEVFTVTGYVEYVDEKENGETYNILALETDRGNIATNSATFAKTFFEIVDLMGELPIDVFVGSGVSKNGRKYIFAGLA